MPETLQKLRPDRDLQCYFERPSAIAAMSGASSEGFIASGTWRQQFDWCVIEWNRDNVFEHPLFRYLPDGDLSGLTLQYEETRENCIPLDSDLFPTVDWPYLRVWAESGGAEEFYRVPLKNYATPIEGSYVCPTAEFVLQGTVTTGEYVGLAWLGEHYTHQCGGSETLEELAAIIADAVNGLSTNMHASATGARITLTYTGEGQTLSDSTVGANGNRLGAYGHVSGSGGLYWENWWQYFSSGQSPSKWRVTLPLDSLIDMDGRTVPMQKVRKMRWTYAADFQRGEFQRSEFQVQVSAWTVTGTNRAYRVAGPGSRRIEDDSKEVSYYGTWEAAKGNFSGGTIRSSATYSHSFTIPYTCPVAHELFLGTRLLSAGPEIALRVDDEQPRVLSLQAAGEDTLLRLPLGSYAPGAHTVLVSHNGPTGNLFFFDFLEIAVPAESIADQPVEPAVTLATDWDTDHSIALPPERTAWMIHSLGFHGRVNHYTGALWFYELVRPGHQYASVTVDFSGIPEPSAIMEILIGQGGAEIHVPHVNLYGDTAATIAKAYELELNRGYTAIRAEAVGTQLRIYSRAMGSAGNAITCSGSPASGGFSLTVSGASLSGGTDSDWRTDLHADPRINRACRDWSRKFYEACRGYGLDVTAAFSMELQHGDPSPAAGIAQRYPNGEPTLLTTPALQTNFSPTSRAFWEKVHLQMAGIMAEAGCVPYLQFGEVQWWYFPLAGSGMPYYDQWTKDRFLAAYGFPMRTVPSREAEVSAFPEEAALLPSLIGDFTDAIRTYVLSAHPECRFEVLYPTDVNDTPWNTAVNYPLEAWTPAKLDNLKTESFTYTGIRDLNKSRHTIEFGAGVGFPRNRRSFLVGPGDSSTTWQKEAQMAKGENLESIVLFALDQFCLIGYPVPFWPAQRKSCRF